MATGAAPNVTLKYNMSVVLSGRKSDQLSDEKVMKKAVITLVISVNKLIPKIGKHDMSQFLTFLEVIWFDTLKNFLVKLTNVSLFSRKSGLFNLVEVFQLASQIFGDKQTDILLVLGFANSRRLTVPCSIHDHILL